MALILWLIALAFTLVYLPLRAGQRDLLLQICTRLAWTLPTWLGVCFGLWLVGGGWGPPCLVFFLILGAVHGIVAGAASWEGRQVAVPGGEADQSVG
jgi:hypothetical protein